MPNADLTIDMITKESLRILENNLSFTKGVNRQFDDSFGVAGAKIGDTLRIRKPARYTVRTTPTLSVQDHTETNATLQLSNQIGVDVNFTSKELALNIDEFADRILKPAIAAVSNKIDFDGLTLYQSVYNSVGTAGAVPSALLTFLNGFAKMKDDGCPVDADTSVVVSPLAEASMVDTLKTLFQSSTEISKQYTEGKMGIAGGMKWSMDQNVNAHTVGVATGTPLVDGASQTGSTLVTKGWTNGVTNILKKGDTFTIDGVYHVNPQTRLSSGVLQQFVVTANANSGSSTGPATLSISPPITVTTAFQTVSASPADNAPIHVTGTGGTVTPQNMIYHKDAFVLGCADLPLPGGVDMAARASSPKLGLSVRFVRAYDINNDAFPCRFDILYGWSALYPQLACRVYG